MNVRQEHRSFQSLFSDPNTCPLGTGDELKEGIAYAYRVWDTTTTASTPEDIVNDTLCTLSEPAGGIGMFQSDTNCPSGCLRLLHGVHKYPGCYGREDPYKGKVFGYLDDIDGLDITTSVGTAER